MESPRDRIAAALQSADRRLALEDEMPAEVYYAAVADAVIAALQDTAIPRRIRVEAWARDCVSHGDLTPENLRDRIAAVIIEAIAAEYDHLRYAEALAAADAVIAALGIRLTGETLADAISRVDDWRGITDPVVLADAILASLKGLTRNQTRPAPSA